MLKNRFLWLYFIIFGAILAAAAATQLKTSSPRKEIKLYWFIPDGLRAEPTTFKIFSWAEDGTLPNIKKLMDRGAYGYSRPVFPSHTPVNFATLMTGTSPKIHGIADGSMRISGYPLSMVIRGGFNSASKLVPSIWSILEKNSFLVSLLSVPGSTPPELSRGNTIRGRWGAWGLDFPAVIFQDDRDEKLKTMMGVNKKVFSFGPDLTKFTAAYAPRDWRMEIPSSFSPAQEVTLDNWGFKLYGIAIDTTDDHLENYDELILSKDKIHKTAQLRIGDWSDWIPAHLIWETRNDYNKNTPKKSKLEEELSSVSVDTSLKVNIIRLGKKDRFRIRILYDNNNDFSTQPAFLSKKINDELGPMVDFVDNYPPQLIYFKEDKKTFLEEADLSLDWHRRAVPFLKKTLNSEAVIQSIYTPNQMLTSRWWMPYIDPQSPRYHEVDEATRAQLWQEVKKMYIKIDAIVGEIIRNADPDTYIVFSSDHGALPLYKEVRLNNFFAKKGWLKFKFNKALEEYEVDWENSRVVFLQMNNIYINSKSLGGPYHRENSPEYYKLRNEVIQALKSLHDHDEDNSTPTGRITAWEDAEEELDLPADRIGDLVVANNPPYLWTEDLSEGKEIFVKSLRGGYKQAVDNNNPSLLTPFIIAGPKIKSGHKLSQTINHADQLPTILKALDIDVPKYVTGKEIQEAFR